MQADLPHTLYIRRNRKGKKKDKPFRYNPEDKAIKLQEEANRRAEERRKAKAEGKIPYTTQELFRQ